MNLLGLFLARCTRFLHEWKDRIKASLPAITVSGIFHPARKWRLPSQALRPGLHRYRPEGQWAHCQFYCTERTALPYRECGPCRIIGFRKRLFSDNSLPIRNGIRNNSPLSTGTFLVWGWPLYTAPKNVASLRGYSWDTSPLFRHRAKPYRKWTTREAIEKKRSSSIHFTRDPHASNTKARVEQILQKIVERRIDITQNEPDWFRLACAFANEFAEEGREYFHVISQFHPQYNRQQADQKFDHARMGQYQSIGIGTFFSLASKI